MDEITLTYPTWVAIDATTSTAVTITEPGQMTLPLFTSAALAQNFIDREFPGGGKTAMPVDAKLLRNFVHGSIANGAKVVALDARRIDIGKFFNSLPEYS
jgi:hypothetical protein